LARDRGRLSPPPPLRLARPVVAPAVSPGVASVASSARSSTSAATATCGSRSSSFRGFRFFADPDDFVAEPLFLAAMFLPR
jgi:hypothetical protein